MSQLQSRMEYLNRTTCDREVTTRLEIKIRDLETKLELEQAAKAKAEVCIYRKEFFLISFVGDNSGFHYLYLPFV